MLLIIYKKTLNLPAEIRNNCKSLSSKQYYFNSFAEINDSIIVRWWNKHEMT